MQRIKTKKRIEFTMKYYFFYIRTQFYFEYPYFACPIQGWWIQVNLHQRKRKKWDSGISLAKFRNRTYGPAHISPPMQEEITVKVEHLSEVCSTMLGRRE